MKTCTKCKIEQSLSEFNKRGKGLQPWCRTCNRARSRQYYAKNRSKHIDTIRKRNEIRRNDVQQKICEYLSQHPCVDCGETDIVVLEFDHQRDKEMNVSRLVNSYGWKRVQVEIEKCEVVCANCHRRRTATSQEFYRLAYTGVKL